MRIDCTNKHNKYCPVSAHFVLGTTQPSMFIHLRSSCGKHFSLASTCEYRHSEREDECRHQNYQKFHQGLAKEIQECNRQREDCCSQECSQTTCECFDAGIRKQHYVLIVCDQMPSLCTLVTDHRKDFGSMHTGFSMSYS